MKIFSDGTKCFQRTVVGDTHVSAESAEGGFIIK